MTKAVTQTTRPGFRDSKGRWDTTGTLTWHTTADRTLPHMAKVRICICGCSLILHVCKCTHSQGNVHVHVYIIHTDAIVFLTFLIQAMAIR